MLPVPPFVLLEDRLGEPRGGRLFSAPAATYACRDLGDVPSTLAAIEDAAAAGLHAAGWIGYDCGPAFEPRLAPRAPRASAEPLLWFGAFRRCDRLSAAELDRAFAALAPAAPVTGLRIGASRAAHAGRVRRILDLIAAGDLYQVNLTFPLRFGYAGDPAALYAVLRARQPVAHGALIATGDAWILSISPELFFDAAHGRATCRPMKGTTPRGPDPDTDAARLAALQADPKQRAENLMIVDLLRNDLSRVCRPGSVQVPALFTPETYPTLHTLTSTVTGRLEAGATLQSLLKALFPCGSIVGAPKIRAGEVIAELEPEARGVYTGAIGALSPSGEMRFSVAIRTATLRGDRGVYGVGGGIVADSDPDAEYDEALLKGRPILDLAEDFQLIETLRWAAGGFVRQERHLARLAGSAARLGFACAPDVLRAALAAEAHAWPHDSDRRVRLVLRRDGGHEIASEILGATAPSARKVVIAPEPLDAADPLLRHKTTFRARQEAAFALAGRAGADEAILLNREGRVADASRATVFLRRGGTLITPPVEDGALPGVLRAELLDRGQARVGRLTVDDLAEGDFFIGSSLRGLMPAELRR